ncbi:hypothetical protein KC335_g127 [Hortaea werneckii]|nr:hypothetical protein KC335_g127 [Hortaea werneckii]
MSGSYRIEVCPNNRATCSATQCKKEGVKILKGELRQGVVVMFQDKQSWKYRHWGCVTPEVLHNWHEKAEGDMELIDGYDELPEDAQDKVKRALEQGHVDDEDWKGDVECNRYNGKKGQGMFVKKPKKQAEDEDEDEEAEPTPKKATKKRGRAKDDEAGDEVDEKPAPKKGRKKAAKPAEDDAEKDADAKPAPKKGGKQAAKPAEDEEVEDAPPAKKPRKSAKAKSAANGQESSSSRR